MKWNRKDPESSVPVLLTWRIRLQIGFPWQDLYCCLSRLEWFDSSVFCLCSILLQWYCYVFLEVAVWYVQELKFKSVQYEWWDVNYELYPRLPWSYLQYVCSLFVISLLVLLLTWNLVQWSISEKKQQHVVLVYHHCWKVDLHLALYLPLKLWLLWF